MTYILIPLSLFWIGLFYLNARKLRGQVAYLEKLSDEQSRDEQKLVAQVEELEDQLFKSSSRAATLRADVRGLAKRLIELSEETSK